MDDPPTHETYGPKRNEGFVYTFYSFKGGVGRSMALANVGVLMALRGYRVLLVDWDLEAPGLEAYFRNVAELSGKPSQTPGIVELLEAHAKNEVLNWRSCLLHANFIDSSLDIILAGRKSPDYRNRVQGLDWEALFRKHRIGNHLNNLREEWRKEYNFVLIDSRTGITDIGDICTVIMPDALVLMLITNYQNINGIREIMQRAHLARNKLAVNRSRLIGIPLLGRDEIYSEYDKSLEWRRIVANELGPIYKEWLPKEIEPADALNKLFIPYITNWSFGERIPVLESDRELKDPTSIGNAYARLTVLLINNLDWYAFEQHPFSEELQSTRILLKKVRQEAEEAKEEVKSVSKKSIKFSLLIALTAGILAGSFSWWYNSVSKKWNIDTSNQVSSLIDKANHNLLSLEKTLGPEHLDVANSLDNLATLYDSKGDYSAAEPLLQRAVAIREKALGPEDPITATSLSNLATLYMKRGDYSAAEPLLQRALAIREKALGPERPSTATSLSNLATLYMKRGDYSAAEPLLKRALAIREKALGPEDPITATSLSNLATLYMKRGDYSAAEPLLKRALAIREKALGPEDPNVANLLDDLAKLYESKGEYQLAEPLVKRSLAIRDKTLGSSHPALASVLENLAKLKEKEGQYPEAEVLLQRSLKIREEAFGPDQPNLAGLLINLSTLYKKMGKTEEAKKFAERVEKIESLK